MKKNYNQIITFIENSQKFGIKLGLDTMIELMNRLDNPQDNLKIIHVAGTNGKGSTVSYIERCLIEEGYKVGSYISPSLFSYEERMKVDLEPISRKDFVDCFNKIIIASEQMVHEGKDAPTEFELFTAVAFLYFSQQKVDFAVVEVGLGGRYDATNIVKPIISVITPIDIDHAGILGDTYEQIAYEKAGIIKQGVPAVVAKQNKEVMGVIRQVAIDKEAKLICGWHVECAQSINTDIYYNDQNAGDENWGVKNSNIEGSSIQWSKTLLGMSYKNLGFDGSLFLFDGREYHTRLIGEHQVENAILSLSVLKELSHRYSISNKALKLGIENTKWQCRLERIKKSPDIILDGAHNPHGARALVKAMQQILLSEADKDLTIKKSDMTNDNLIIILGMLSDKDIDGVIDEIMPLINHASSIIVTEPVSDRRLEANILAYKLQKAIDKSVEEKGLNSLNCINIKSNYIEALNLALNSLNPNSKLIIFGSFYLVAPIRIKILKSE